MVVMREQLEMTMQSKYFKVFFLAGAESIMPMFGEVIGTRRQRRVPSSAAEEVRDMWMCGTTHEQRPASGTWFLLALVFLGVGAPISTGWSDDRSPSIVPGPNEVLFVEAERITYTSPYLEGAFGAEIEFMDDLMVVGAPMEYEARGAVYLLRENEWGWEQLERFAVPGVGQVGMFGSEISACDGRILVGAAGADWGADDAGAVVVYEHVDGAWARTAFVLAPSPRTGENFSNKILQWDGGYLVAASSRYLAGVGTRVGSILELRNEGGLWVFGQEVFAPDPVASGYFGRNLEVVGDVMFVTAAKGFDSGGEEVVYVMGHMPGEWYYDQLIASPSPDPAAGFGRSLEVADGFVAISASREDHSGLLDAGAVYLYEKVGRFWVQTQRLESPDPATEEYFGGDLELVDGVLLVTAGGYHHLTGIVYAFVRGPGGWTYQHSLRRQDPYIVDRFGVVESRGGEVYIGALGEYNGTYPGFVTHFRALRIFHDDLESGDLTRWDATSAGGP